MIAMVFIKCIYFFILKTFFRKDKFFFRASLILLSKEANTKDTQLKSQLLLSFKDDNPSKGSEQPGFFGVQRSDLTIPKANFPEFTLTYVNQARVSLVKSGEKALYCDFVILA